MLIYKVAHSQHSVCHIHMFSSPLLPGHCNLEYLGMTWCFIESQNIKIISNLVHILCYVLSKIISAYHLQLKLCG